MRGAANLDAREFNKTHAPAANTAAVCTVDAVADEYWVLDSIHWSYDLTLMTAETLIVTFDSVAKFSLNIPAGTHPPGEIIFERGLYLGVGNENEAMVVTLSAPANGEVGKLNITYR